MSLFADLSGQTILVTGASSGIGRATCLELSQRGARLVLLGRSPQRLQEVHGSLKGAGHVWRSIDLESDNDLGLLFSELVSEVGPLSGLVCAAGVQIIAPLRSQSREDLRRMLRLNVEVASELLQQFRIKTNRTPAASAVMVSSVMGLVGQPGQSAYGASKAALNGMVKSLAMELAREGVRINSVAPGLVDTPMADQLRETLSSDQFTAVSAMHPLGLGRPEDVAHAITFLLSDQARWITGTVLTVDGGYTAH